MAVLVAFTLPNHHTSHAAAALGAAASRACWLQLLGRRRRDAEAARLGLKPLCALAAAGCTALGAPAFARRPRHAAPEDAARAPGRAAGATRGGAGAQRHNTAERSSAVVFSHRAVLAGRSREQPRRPKITSRPCQADLHSCCASPCRPWRRHP
eukprot:scaffold58452_cov67-Phaeocystis_antarctica.AAC.1